MPTVYSAASTQWPLLQSKTEQKFKSGLFNVSAEFIRPVGNTELPTSIETSIGPVDVWPEPTVTTGTDGFERINATGYGVWDAGISEVTYDFTADTLPVYWMQQTGENEGFYIVSRSLPVIFESVHIRKIGDAIPSLPQAPSGDPDAPLLPGLRILSATGSNITNQPINISQFPGAPSPAIYDGTFEKPIRKLILPTMVKKNTYGTIIETEVVYGYIKHDAVELTQSTALPYGTFLFKTT